MQQQAKEHALCSKSNNPFKKSVNGKGKLEGKVFKTEYNWIIIQNDEVNDKWI